METPTMEEVVTPKTHYDEAPHYNWVRYVRIIGAIMLIAMSITAYKYYGEYQEQKEAKEQAVQALRESSIANEEKNTRLTQHDIESISEVNGLNSDIMIMQEKRRLYNDMTDKQINEARKMKKSRIGKLESKGFTNDYILNPEKYRIASCNYNEKGDQECKTSDKAIGTGAINTGEVLTGALEYNPEE